jgi:hypothetical protein
MNGSNSDRYDDLATAIARILRSICDFEMDGHPAFTYANSNDLDAPCDMLARLGLMKEHSVQHVFSRDWPLLQTAPLVRHAGEPSLNDLIRGLCFFVDWFPSVPRDAEHADVPTDFPDVGERSQQDRLHKWSVQEGRRLLEELGIGRWSSRDVWRSNELRFLAALFGQSPKKDVFEMTGDFAKDDWMELYWMSRKADAARLGGETCLYPA